MKKEKKPWPTDAAMQQVYDMNLWGSNDSRFYSGSGSHDAEIIEPYITKVSAFLNSFETPLVVCDLGCGDFNVGKDLVARSKQYIAVDIVPNLITHNKEIFKDKRLEFRCSNIATDALPAGDCALVRQVLQHLSNAEVQAVLQKLSTYKYIILTEHVPDGTFVSNKDIISGQGIRLKKQSGLDVLAAPFHFEVKEQTELLSVPLKDGSGVIVTWLFEKN